MVRVRNGEIEVFFRQLDFKGKEYELAFPLADYLFLVSKTRNLEELKIALLEAGRRRNVALTASA